MIKKQKKLLSRRDFVSLGALALAGSLCFGKVSAKTRPNVIFIMADDLGYADLSCYGRLDYQTPNLDKLAKEGIRFTNAYSASPVCTPTRCAFMTGRYPARTEVGLQEPLSWRKVVGDKVGLPSEHPTIASLLKASGYRTALIGKWHLGYLPKFSPLKSGFDEFFGTMSGGAGYFNHLEANGERDLYEGNVPVEKIGYLTDLLTERAIQFISRAKEDKRPFYLSLHYTAPHFPWESPQDPNGGQVFKQGYKEMVAGGSPQIYAEMMKSLDDGIGKVMEALEKSGLDQKTLVIFTSDNGGERFSDNAPFSGSKFELLEGGVRVPAIVRWTNKIPPNRLTEQVAITMDWTATILAAAETKPTRTHPLDGKNLLPVCLGKKIFERTIFWRNGEQKAVRKKNWKYLRTVENEFLFDLQTDPQELTNLKDVKPEMFRQLKTEFQKWNATVLPQAKQF